MLRIRVDTTEAAAVLIRVRGVLGAKEAMHKVAAASVSKLVRSWLLARNGRSSTSNYWSRAAEATTHESDASSARVIIRHPGVGWHRYGGTINAKPGKALAIPLKAAVKGIWPSEKFPNKGDAFIYRKNGKAFLAAREGGALRIFYLLVKSVSKTADRSVLPDETEIWGTAAASILKLIHTRLSRRTR